MYYSQMLNSNYFSENNFKHDKYDLLFEKLECEGNVLTARHIVKK